MNSVSTEEVLNKAYRLAYFLHQDKGIATRIVGAATLKLNVAMAVQSKRLYYIPVGRFSQSDLRRTHGIRNKALFSDLHLLQRLIYGESEPFERQKERAAMAAPPDVRADGDPASDEDLLVYFIKHLVRITTKRNAFYVTLGVSRLLHSYSTVETMEIYNAVIGEPERVKDDYYYRSRKAVLMHEMYERFGQLIRACRQRRGEERFETQQGSSEQRSLVRECLRLFTPWDTQCPVPRDFDPFKSIIASLTSQSSAEENRIEVSRIHAILHPGCFERLVAAFGYGAPAERMELPRFFSQESDDQSPPRQRNAPTELSSEELAEISHMLDEQAGRRRRAATNAAIRILVDGVERGRLNPAEHSSISFSAEEDAEMVEVKTMDAGGDLLLATHLLTAFEDDAPLVSSIRLEGGQELSLSITRRPIGVNGKTDLLIKLGYQETSLRRAARLWWQRMRLGFRQEQDVSAGSLWGGRISARYILVGSLVVLCLMSYLAYVVLTSRQTSGPERISSVQTTNPPATNTPAGVNEKINAPEGAPTKAPEPQQSASQPAPRISNDRSTSSKTPTTVQPAPGAEPSTGEEDRTRSTNVVPNLRLGDIKKVYIEMRGDAASSELRNNLVETLGSSGVVAVTTNADEADAALRIEVRNGLQNQVSARLVNARGTVLWSKAGLASEIINDLLAEIRLAKK